MKYFGALLTLLIVFASCSTLSKSKNNIQPTYQGPAVQTSFFGCKLGDSYSSVSRTLNRKFNYNNISRSWKEKSITVVDDASFGGQHWNLLIFRFNSNGKCMEVEFQSHFKDSNTAGKVYNSVYSNLKERYGEERLSALDSGCGYLDYIGNMVVLEKEYSESKGGTLYWYVHITYYDGELEHVEQRKTVFEM